MIQESDFPHDGFQQQLKRLNETKPSSETVEAVLSEFGYKKLTKDDLNQMAESIREVYPDFDPPKF